MRAIITGAASGIGAATVIKLKAQGVEVTALDIVKPENVDQWVPVDMSSPDEIDRAVGQISGRFDCLINNAGLPPRPGIEHQILYVNFLALVRCTYAILPMLNPGAAIVNTASRAGAGWRENLAQIKLLLAVQSANQLHDFIAQYQIDPVRAYNLSKEATIVWTIAQTESLIGQNLRMNCVSPSAVATDILTDFTNAFGPKVAKNLERIGRPGHPDEIADLIVFLCSPQSHWLKGTDIAIDGGTSALVMSDQLELSSLF